MTNDTINNSHLMTNTRSAQVTNTDWQIQQNFNTYINIE